MDTANTSHTYLSTQQLSVYSCLCYFDVFHYPSKLKEIFLFMNNSISERELKDALARLIELKLVKKEDKFFLLQHADPANIEKRLEGEKRFRNKQKHIRFFSGIISRFPFVESVAISGSCSKGLLDADGDVDYFVITSPGRLWLCRSILVAFKKIVLFNSKKFFCVNYFLSADRLEIPDRNRFVACEISTLMPVSNKALFEQFLNANVWVKDFLPNKGSYNPMFIRESKPQKPLSKLVEWICRTKLGDLLDQRFFKLTLNTWEKKFNDFSREDFDLNMRSRKHVSKHHPRGFQKKVLQEFENRLASIHTLAVK